VLFYFVYLAEEVKDKASEKVEEAADKAKEVAADAEGKGQGKRNSCMKTESSNISFLVDDLSPNSEVHTSPTGTVYIVSSPTDQSVPASTTESK
jgi:hypothetical protein